MTDNAAEFAAAVADLAQARIEALEAENARLRKALELAQAFVAKAERQLSLLAEALER